MNRYVDSRSGQPATAYSELVQTEWALFWNDDWRLNERLTHQRRRALRELRDVRGSQETLANLLMSGSGSFNEQLASARVDIVDRFYAPDNNNLSLCSGSRGIPRSGCAKMSVCWRLRDCVLDRLMNLPAEN